MPDSTPNPQHLTPDTRPYSSPLARASDPETSQAAADSAAADGTIETHERRILAVLKHMPAGGTASEIAQAVRERWRIAREIDFCKHTVCRRLSDLIGLGLIHRRIAPMATARARAARGDRRGRPILIKRGGETVHYYGRPGQSLFPDWRERT
jgi:hypothetical protein